MLKMSHQKKIKKSFLWSRMGRYRKKIIERRINITYKDVLDDIFNTSKTIGARGGIEKPIFTELENGVKTIKDYIFSRNYIIEDAVNSAAKAAYLSLLLKNDSKHVERFVRRMDLQSLKITSSEFKKFKSINKFDPEAYFEVIEKESVSTV